MASELSSNWKKLQAKIKTESVPAGPLKRKPENSLSVQPPAKKPKSGTAREDKAHIAPRQPRSAKAVQMGVGQSSIIEDVAKSGPSPSLSLWAEENEISPEDLAEAYGLGLKNNSMLTSEKDKVNSGLIEGLDVGKYVGIDCEMVGVGQGGYESVLARVSIVDFHGRQVYDSYVRSKERVTDWRSAVSGITPKHMRFARDFEEVQAQVAELLKGRILVGHDVKHDLEALILNHPAKDIRDTSNFSVFRKYGHGRKPSLKKLAEEILGVEIQAGPHSSIEDAKVAMLLFRRHKSGFDVEHANRYPTTSGARMRGERNGSKTKKSKKKKMKS